MESRLIPVNAILDLALADGLNPAPLADAGWAVAALEVPVRASGRTVVCDVVLFNPQAGHLLAVEAKSGANLEPEQGRRLAALTPDLLVIAGGITVPKPVPLRCGVLYACLAEYVDRICLGADEAGLRFPVLAVSGSDARLLRPQIADPLLSAAFSSPAVWTHPIARIVPFDHESPADAFDQPVRAELISTMARQRPWFTLTETGQAAFDAYLTALQEIVGAQASQPPPPARPMHTKPSPRTGPVTRLASPKTTRSQQVTQGARSRAAHCCGATSPIRSPRRRVRDSGPGPGSIRASKPVASPPSTRHGPGLLFDHLVTGCAQDPRSFLDKLPCRDPARPRQRRYGFQDYLAGCAQSRVVTLDAHFTPGQDRGPGAQGRRFPADAG